MLKKKPTLSSQTRWGKLFNLMKMNKHMIPKNDANICTLSEKTKFQMLIGVNKKNPPCLQKARWITLNVLTHFK